MTKKQKKAAYRRAEKIVENCDSLMASGKSLEQVKDYLETLPEIDKIGAIQLASMQLEDMFETAQELEKELDRFENRNANIDNVN